LAWRGAPQSQAFSFMLFLVDFFSVCDILIDVMREMNFEQLKEDLQTRICQWADNLERESAYPHLNKSMDTGGRVWVYSKDEKDMLPRAAWNDLDQLCDIVAETVNDFKRLDK